MRIYYTDPFVLPLPPGHRFPMRKYALLRERVAAVASDLLIVPAPSSDAELALAHDPAYVAAVAARTLDERAQRRIGIPWSAAMVERSRRSTGATLGACRSTLDSAGGVNLVGGTHHAHRDYGEGFCVFNDAAVALRVLQREGRVHRALVVDLDVHQGDGTASIFDGDESAYTMSMHGRHNFPFRKHASRLDIELDDGTGDDAYLATLRAALPPALEQARPDLAIYLAGADRYAGARLGRLALSKPGLAVRDAYVLDELARRSVPVAIALAGGYADAVEDVADIHFATMALALERHDGRHVLDFSHRSRDRSRVQTQALGAASRDARRRAANAGRSRTPRR